VPSSPLDSSVYDVFTSSRQATAAEKTLLSQAESLASLDNELGRLHADLLPGTILIYLLESEKLAKEVVVGGERFLFAPASSPPADAAAAALQTMLGETALSRTLDAVRRPQHEEKHKSDKGLLRRVPASSEGHDALFALLVPEPDRVLARWNVKAASDDILEPFLSALGNASSVNARSQVVYLQRLDIKPRAAQGGYILSGRDLGLAINPVESQLASHVSSKPRLNFLAYVPTVEQSPLHIVDNEGNKVDSNAFLIPR